MAPVTKSSKTSKKKSEVDKPEDLELEPDQPSEQECETDSTEVTPDEKPKKTVKKRKVATIESHLAKYDKIMTQLDSEIESKKVKGDTGSRFLSGIRKQLVDMKKDVPRICSGRNRRTYTKSATGNMSGFDLPCEITPELSKFLKLKDGETVSRKDVTNALCVYIRLKPKEDREQMLKWAHLNPKGSRDLQDPANKMGIIPDASLSKLLSYKQYQKDVKDGKITKEQKNKETGKKVTVVVTDDVLKYYVVQRLIKSHILGTVKST